MEAALEVAPLREEPALPLYPVSPAKKRKHSPAPVDSDSDVEIISSYHPSSPTLAEPNFGTWVCSKCPSYLPPNRAISTYCVYCKMPKPRAAPADEPEIVLLGQSSVKKRAKFKVMKPHSGPAKNQKVAAPDDDESSSEN